MKTLFVPASGSRTDAAVFATALALARPLGAHMRFLHVHLSPAEAAVHTPHVEFCQGPAITEALSELRAEGEALCAAAFQHFRELCATHDVPVLQSPDCAAGLSASWTEEHGRAAAQLMLHARHSDLTIVGRPYHVDHMPVGLIESLLLGSGRPLVIAADTLPAGLTGTIAVAWKETPQAAHALAASLALLEQARRVVLLSIAEDASASPAALHDLARQLEWHGIFAEVIVLDRDSRPAAEQLQEAAARLNAQLLVAGAYGHGPLKERIFGGVTQALIGRAGLPVLLMC